MNRVEEFLPRLQRTEQWQSPYIPLNNYPLEKVPTAEARIELGSFLSFGNEFSSANSSRKYFAVFSVE
jgi:hypothetical protein